MTTTTTTKLYAYHQPVSQVWEAVYIGSSIDECEQWGNKNGKRNSKGHLIGEAYALTNQAEIKYLRNNKPELFLIVDNQPTPYTVICESIKVLESIQLASVKCNQAYQDAITIALENMRTVRQGM